jgi:excisionase family DNA binding protein
MTTETYFTVSEIAARFRVTPATVLNWIKGGVLDAYQLGGVYRITEEQIQTMLRHRGE